MTFGHSVFDSFGADTDAFNLELFGYTFCLDDTLKSNKGGHKEEHINDCEGGDGHKYSIIKKKACKDRSGPKRKDGEHYFQLTHKKPCEPCATEDADCECYDGWERVGGNGGKTNHRGYKGSDTTAEANALNNIREAAINDGMQWKGCMDANASNYDEDAVCPDPANVCVCNEGYIMGDDGTCEEVAEVVTTDDGSTDDTSTDDGITTHGELNLHHPPPGPPAEPSKLPLIIGLGVLGVVAFTMMGKKKE